MKRLGIDVQPGEYVVARLAADAAVPAELLAPGPAFVSVTRTADELSVVCAPEAVPSGATAEPGWRLLSVRGPLSLALTGIVAALANELAAAGVGLVTLSTYDTDHVLVKESDLGHAVDALRAAGHEVHLPA